MAATKTKTRPLPELLQWINQSQSLLRLMKNLEKQSPLCGPWRHAEMDATALKEDHATLETERDKYIKYIKTQFFQLKEISHKIQTLVSKLTTEAGDRNIDSQSVDTVKLQRLMETLQSGISTFKCRMKNDFEDTMKQERDLSREVKRLNERFLKTNKDSEEDDSDDDEYHRVVRKRPVVGLPAKTTDVTSRDEIEAINKQIEMQGGLLGGWHSQEHKFFLTAWGQTFGANTRDILHCDSQVFRRGLTRLKQRAQIEVPSKRSDEVESHALWYCNLQKLLELKKATVDKWRKLKESESHISKNEIEKDSQPKVSPPSPRRPRVSETKRRAVEEWRARKEEEELRAQEDMRRAQMEKAQESVKSKALQRQKQEAVALYRLEKEQRSLHEAQVKATLKNSDNCNQKFTEAELRQRRAADLETAKLKREMLMKKADGNQRDILLQQKGRKRREAVQEKVAKDPSRAVQGTQNSMHKAVTGDDLDSMYDKRSATSAHGAPVAMGAYDLKRSGARAVPSWRRNA